MTKLDSWRIDEWLPEIKNEGKGRREVCAAIKGQHEGSLW